MTHFDVFNGDADGICALHQLRLATPLDSVLVSGVKRDIALLQRVAAQDGDSVTVLDISAAVNRSALVALLDRGVRVEYFDHHFAGDLPRHAHLSTLIDPSPRVCTAMLVDRHLGGRHRIWAVVGAFGDNLPHEARVLAGGLNLSDEQLRNLRSLGETLSYNAYGDVEADLLAHPASLYRRVHGHADPFDFMRRDPIYPQISERRREDLREARTAKPEITLPGAVIYVLPDGASSRRVRGVFVNELARSAPAIAHAVLTGNAQGGYAVSVRAPLANATGADALCRQFATGGGRVAAAGINHLPQGEFPAFVRALGRAFPGP